MKKNLFARIAVSASLMCASAFAQTANAQDAPAAQNSIKLVRVIAAMPAGTQWSSLGIGSLCGARQSKIWDGGRVAQDISPYADSLKKELEQAGYKVVVPGDANLFDPSPNSADYQVAAVITDEHVYACTGGLFVGGSQDDIRGSSDMKIDWQIYSPISKQVVAQVTTSGAAKLDQGAPGGMTRLVIESFAANVRELAANTAFKTALSAPKAFTKGFVMPGQQSPIILAGSLKAPSVKISDAVGSVVTILTGNGSGSGVLVSSDGYMLTDAHVVGDEKAVRVRWPDGIEALAEVVRVAQNRDVAVIKTNPRDRTPLAIRRGAVTPGQRVYAIGSPKGKEFEGTVSSGVISATRTRNGLRYIQSDTTVSHGSSGGPLLDETGAIIGLTDLGFDNDGPAGLNLFTPVGDAMDFLTLVQQ